VGPILPPAPEELAGPHPLAKELARWPLPS